MTIEPRNDRHVVSHLGDLGPMMTHNYELLNLGLQTVHNVEVSKGYIYIYINYICLPIEFNFYWQVNIYNNNFRLRLIFQ